MDATLKVVVTAAVLMMIAVVLFFLVSDRAGSFGETSKNEMSAAECKLGKSKFRTACQCDRRVPDRGKVTKIKDKYEDSCEWAKSGTFTCIKDVCN